MRGLLSTLAIAFCVVCCASDVTALERFPPPDFESGYELPETTTPQPSSFAFEYVDVVILLGALGISAYLALIRRSRKSMFVLMLLSLGYFGFWKKGCVCSIGAIQNVALSLFDGGYAVPLFILLLFLLPLIFALLYGRVFCAAVCPLGAIQDVVVLKPIRVPRWLEDALGLLPYLYLGLAVLLAATGSAFLICRYDPFVSFFRLSGGIGMLSLGGALLAIGLFVARPYCRFLCPYGALLRLCSAVSWRHTKISPDECIECRLCETACPFGAIQEPTAHETTRARTEGMGALSATLLLLPVLVIAGGWAGGSLRGPLSRFHPTVRLAERIAAEEAGIVEDRTDASEAFRRTGRQTRSLYEEAAALRNTFAFVGRLFGAWVGLVIGIKLVSLSVRRTRTGYEPDRWKCLSCGRCFMSCPQERKRKKQGVTEVGTHAS